VSRAVRSLTLLLFLHHIDGVCRASAPRDVVAEAVNGMVTRALGVFSEYATYRLASLPVDAPRRPAVDAPRRPACKSLPPSRRLRDPLVIEPAPVVVPVVEQVQQYEEG
jgi:hypothetical protein